MRFGIDLVAGGTRRRAAVVAASMAAMLAMCVGAGALKPADAEAFAWKDNCTFLVNNNTGIQSAVRPTLYLPALPAPASLAEYAIFAVKGIPVSPQQAAFSNWGIPLSNGCHARLQMINPGATANCVAEAPTEGANTFYCDGNSTYRIKDNNDDISGEIWIPARSSGSPAMKPDEAQTTGGSVRASALPGSGWRTTEDIGDFGIAGKLMETGELPASCNNSGKETAPNTARAEMLIRGGGDEGSGALVTSYDNSAQATASTKEALSDQSIGCLVKLLNTADTKVAATPLPAAEAGDVEGDQLVISRRGGDGGDFRPVAYLDVIGSTDGDEAAVQLYETVGAAPSETQETEAIEAVRIGS
jgi:hypothetical protein